MYLIFFILFIHSPPHSSVHLFKGLEIDDQERQFQRFLQFPVNSAKALIYSTVSSIRDWGIKKLVEQRREARDVVQDVGRHLLVSIAVWHWPNTFPTGLCLQFSYQTIGVITWSCVKYANVRNAWKNSRHIPTVQ